MSGIPTNRGNDLNREWKVGARHALYHKRGTWYMPLKRFPGALFDPNGYIRFETREAFEACSHIQIGERVNVAGGISRIPGYTKRP